MPRIYNFRVHIAISFKYRDLIKRSFWPLFFRSFPSGPLGSRSLLIVALRRVPKPRNRDSTPKEINGAVISLWLNHRYMPFVTISSYSQLLNIKCITFQGNQGFFLSPFLGSPERDAYLASASDILSQILVGYLKICFFRRLGTCYAPFFFLNLR